MCLREWALAAAPLGDGTAERQSRPSSESMCADVQRPEFHTQSPSAQNGTLVALGSLALPFVTDVLKMIQT